MTTRPKIRIATVDIPSAFATLILDLVGDRFDFEITDRHDADFVLHSVGGFDVLKYSGVRIFVTGENVTPNFQISDYAMAFDKLFFGDRYLWFPLIKIYRDAYQTLLKPRKAPEEVLRSKSEFCAYVMSNTTNSAEQRIRCFDRLNEYKTVNSGGRWRNNVGGPVKDKLAFQSKHKFALAFENCSSPGYLTEKFAEAAMADTIPIYWGDPEIGTLFNEKAFINCHKFSSFEAVVERVKEVDQTPKVYQAMLAEPWFPNEQEPTCLSDNTVRDFLSHIFNQSTDKAFRRNQGRWGLKIEQQLYQMAHQPLMRGAKILKKKWHSMRKGQI